MVIALIISLLIGIFLLIRLLILKAGIRELNREYIRTEQLNTNALIGISSRDADLRGLTESLNKTHKEVREKYNLYVQGDVELKQTITNVTHDLRTPLTAICGYLELLKTTDLSFEESKKYLSIIENRAKYMKDLTEELFEFSKTLGNQKEDLELEPIFINQLLEDSIMEYYGAFVDYGLEPEVSITENRIVRSLNRHAMERIIANLISNSLKYSKGDLKIALTDAGVIEFRDFAPELSSVDANRLFDRFYTVQTGKNSTGLGLSIVKAFVNQMGGTIEGAYENGYFIIRIQFPE